MSRKKCLGLALAEGSNQLLFIGHYLRIAGIARLDQWSLFATVMEPAASIHIHPASIAAVEGHRTYGAYGAYGAYAVPIGLGEELKTVSRDEFIGRSDEPAFPFLPVCEHASNDMLRSNGVFSQVDCSCRDFGAECADAGELGGHKDAGEFGPVATVGSVGVGSALGQEAGRQC